jgi:hypothetical protein
VENERVFKGIWIPKEIWLSKELSLREKVMLAEIDSLEDEERGCYASNAHFAEFFGLSVKTVSEIINNLVKKGWIHYEMIKEGEQIIERRLRVNRGYLENVGGYPGKRGEGIPENVEGRNKYRNNIKEIYKEKPEEDSGFDEREDILAHDFEIIYAEYPRKEGKNNAFKAYKAWKAGKKMVGKTIKLTNEQMYNAVIKYRQECEAEKREKKYIKQADTFFRNINEYVEDLE